MPSTGCPAPLIKHREKSRWQDREGLVVFDLDGTLAQCKSALSAEMWARLYDLLGVVKVAVISGGD